MIRILINNCKDLIRKQRGDIPIEKVPEIENRASESYDGFTGFRELVAPLREKDQSIFTLHYVYGLKVREIAACMGMKENTVTSRLKRGREMLRQEITAVH